MVRIAPRRTASVVIPKTPSTAMAELSLATPPASPPIPPHFTSRVRAALRSTSNSTLTMSMHGREKEQAIIHDFIKGIQRPSSSGDSEDEVVLYISGSPGTGKTALVNNVMESLLLGVDVKVVFLNCMAFSTADALWDRLLEEFNEGGNMSGSKGKTKKEDCRTRVLKLLGMRKMKM